MRVSGFTMTEGTEPRAEHLIRRALDDVGSGLDAIPNLSAAMAQLRIEAGELPADELDGYLCECDEDDCPFYDDEEGETP
jgi:hypothetical protein